MTLCLDIVGDGNAALAVEHVVHEKLQIKRNSLFVAREARLCTDLRVRSPLGRTENAVRRRNTSFPAAKTLVFQGYAHRSAH